MTDSKRFPKGWDEERVQRLIDHYDQETEEEAVAADEAAFEDNAQTFVEVPNELVSEVRKLIARHRAS